MADWNRPCTGLQFSAAQDEVLPILNTQATTTRKRAAEISKRTSLDLKIF